MVKRSLPKNVTKEIHDFIRALEADHLPITSVIVFGSYAKGTAHRWSDIDVCVVSPRFRDPWNAMHYLWSKRLHDSGLTIEPIGLRPADLRQKNELTNEIKRSGIVFRQ
ncbi:MAG: nucleotidyltransferase domain-containing protein [Candidatus Magasanikbacteria bacterium]|nr:nucleotidyltransferase domain-containing protein [Candidatus Magasanikbacteria bacterium]